MEVGTIYLGDLLGKEHTLSCASGQGHGGGSVKEADFSYGKGELPGPGLFEVRSWGRMWTQKLGMLV